MHPDLFTAGDSVLLLGEGNFSFAVGLIHLNLPINVTATCLESDVVLEKGKENITYLHQKGTRVLLGVDATKLANHPVLRNEKFSKIIFNFPHVGGKMKIHLNRMLLKQFFLSAAECIDANGRVLVSLCKGQGGTKFDKTVRHWADTWQIVEMGAQGNFVLESVESFRSDLFPNYSSVGYRGGSSAFHTDGALVHVFTKREPLFSNMKFEEILKCFEHSVLDTRYGKLKLAHIHSEMYRNNPFNRNGSVMNYFSKLLITSIENYRYINSFKIRQISDNDMPLYSKMSSGGPICSIENEGKEVFLRHTLFENIDSVLNLYIKNNDVLMYPGLIFNVLGADFSQPPLSCHILLIGDCLLQLVKNYLNILIVKFRKYMEILVLDEKSKDFHKLLSLEKVIIEDERNICIKNEDLHVVVAHVFIIVMDKRKDVTSIPMCVIYPEKLSEVLFNVENWRQFWSKNSLVIDTDNNCIPTLNLACLESVVYKLDISFLESLQFSEEKFLSILWNFAADIIIKVELLNLYQSPDGLKSRCYRITYQSFDRPLCKKKAIEIQEKMLGKILQIKLGVLLR